MMGGKQNGVAIVAQSGQVGEERVASRRVERGRGFVEEKQDRIVDQPTAKLRRCFNPPENVETRRPA